MHIPLLIFIFEHVFSVCSIIVRNGARFMHARARAAAHVTRVRVLMAVSCAIRAQLCLDSQTVYPERNIHNLYIISIIIFSVVIVPDVRDWHCETKSVRNFPS